jgi:hypothetical protein
VSGDAFTLTLPSRADQLGTARSFAAAVARHFSIAGEAVEDLKLAISEACVDALLAGALIHVRAEDAGGSIAFRVDAPELLDLARAPSIDSSDLSSLDELGAPARIQLIRSLFPDATLSEEGAGRAIVFSLPRG